MDALADVIGEFLRVRQLNIAVAALLTLFYLMYQYRSILFKGQIEEEEELPIRRSTCRLSRSRSRSDSRDRTRSYEYKCRRGKKAHRCPNCSKYNYYT